MKISVQFNKYEHTHCCVYGCNSRINYKGNKELSFHNLPFGRSKALIRKWVEAIKLPTRITSTLLVCSRHFLPEDYGQIGETKVLKPHSLPSRNLPFVWRNKFVPRTYGKLIKSIEVRGIGRLRLCFEAKLSRQLRKSQRRRVKQFNGIGYQTIQVEKLDEMATEKPSGSVCEPPAELRVPEKLKEKENVIHISDEAFSKENEEHCLTSEIEIKDEPLSDAEQEEEGDTVEEMLAKLEESQEDRHVTIVENVCDEGPDFDMDLMMSLCSICGEVCDGLHSGHMFECIPCGKSFKTCRQLNAHNLSHFEYRRKGHITDKEAICKVCNMAVSMKSSLNNHMLSHAKDFEVFTCMLCEKPFRNKATFIMHINSHSLHPHHKCKLCGETFKDVENLDRHVLLHKVVARQYTCRSCGQHFKSMTACWAHFNSHMRARSFALKCSLSCDICGRTLSTKATLKEHMFIHSGEKPFECQLCGKKIRHRANFIIHVQGHSLGQPHLCSLCGMGFSKKSELCSHTAAEHPEDLPYLCIICGARFRTETRFHKHAISHDAQLDEDN